MNKRFDKIQQVVIASYPDHCVEKPEDVEDCGDGLFKFLLVELSESEDCDSFETARNRLDRAIKELTDLRSAFEQMDLAE